VQGGTVTAGRKRAAIELVAREEAELRRTARRFSLCEDDAEDAYQRALEIVLTKAPSERRRELLPWTKTVVKHEALALRRYRERMLGIGFDEVGDPVERLATDNAGPGERTEQREANARTREALRGLKPAELRSLTLLAAGYSYAEIGEMTGFSQTKVNRSLVEGRERFRRLLGSSESGERCEQLLPLLSAFCDGEADAAAEAAVREHLRACAACRATMRAYRTAPAAAAALAPVLPPARSLLERAHELLVGLHSRLPGGGGDGGGVTQVAAAGGSRGAGMAALAKLLAVCAGTVGGAACVATGVAPLPLDIQATQSAEPRLERVSRQAIEEMESTEPRYESAPPPAESQPAPKPGPEPRHEPGPEPEASAAAPPEAEAGAVEYAPPAEAAPPAAETSSGSGGGNPAGEFGP
jgi:RNA polymerase sigma factor (sigma-70 family)